MVLSGAQTDTCDNEGKCPLDYAALERHVDVVQFLLKALKCSVEKLALGNQKTVLKLFVVLFLEALGVCCVNKVYVICF